MNGNNPRKTIRKNINYLRVQKARIDARSKKFQKEIERLTALEANAPIETVKAEAERWKDYSWTAFPEEF